MVCIVLCAFTMVEHLLTYLYLCKLCLLLKISLLWTLNLSLPEMSSKGHLCYLSTSSFGCITRVDFCLLSIMTVWGEECVECLRVV